jgi:hypothetical protein
LCQGIAHANFGFKEALALFLDRGEALWTCVWLEAENTRRATAKGAPAGDFQGFRRLVRKKTFEGSSFINVLLETGKRASP